ncbi:outer membrane beta-barrel protein [Acinetobacter baumannii]
MVQINRIVAIIFAAGMSATTFANDDYYSRPMWDLHPYLGIDVGSIDYDMTDKKATTVGVVAGIQFNDYLGLELSWSQSIDKLALYSKNASGIQTQIANDKTIQTYGAGLTFQADLYNKLYAKSYLGVSRIDPDVQSLKDDVGVAKLGLGYQFTPDVATEVTYNYNFSKNDSSNHGVGLQIKYYF